MSYDPRQVVEGFKKWVEDGGLAQWIEYYLNAGDEAKLREIQKVYHMLRQAFGV